MYSMYEMHICVRCKVTHGSIIKITYLTINGYVTGSIETSKGFSDDRVLETYQKRKVFFQALHQQCENIVIKP